MIVPGSALDNYSHPHSWLARVRARATGKEWSYWISGPQRTREEVAEYVRLNYHAVEFLSCEPATSVPGRMLIPIPPEHFQHGILKAVRAELAGRPVDDPRKLITRKRIERKPLWQPHR